MPKILFSPFVSYIGIGIGKTLLSYGLFAAMILIHVPAQWSLVVVWVIGAVVGYRAHASISFGVSGWKLIWIYLFVNAILYGLNAVLLRESISIGLSPLLGQAICILITVPIGFFWLKRWMVKKTALNDMKEDFPNDSSPIAER